MSKTIMSFDLMKAEYVKELESNDLSPQLISHLQKKFQQFSSIDHDKHAVVDQALRDHLLNLLSSKTLSKENIVETCEMHMNICIEACRQDMCSATMPILLLGDVFDTSTLDICEELFSFVEKNVDVWKEEMFFCACKNNLLRMCNDLLRRLSRSQNTVFCGRILLFLAKFFPFSERSGLNIISEFNLENVTEYSKDSFEKIDEKEDIQSASGNKINVDFNLYTKFWALQDFFRNPTLCYNKIQWKTFTSYCGCVLSAFKNFKLDEINVSKDSISMSIESQLQGQHYFAKFLTNQKLLELELSDVNFRRYILVQFLILFQYLMSPVKFKMDNCELKLEQQEWIKTTMDQVYSLLQETPPDGAAFIETLKHIFQREEYWNNWKNEGCAEFKKPEPPTAEEKSESELEKSNLKKQDNRLVGDIIKEATEKKQFYMGNAELDKLWNHAADNLESCRAKQRDFLPSVESYFEEAVMEADPSLMLEDQYKKVNDGNFGWRALRLLARRSPYFFVQSNNPINTLPEYLDIMMKKIFKEKHAKLHVVDGTKADTEQEQSNAVEMTEAGNMDEDLIKNEEKSTKNENSSKTSLVTKEQLDSVASLVAYNWRGLGKKLGLQPDEIEFVLGQRPTDIERAQYVLQLWLETDDDPLVENLVYILEGLEMTAAAQLLKPNS